mmetsp:Transcript_13746/g.20602  ORF Transcript_13746/g.20602 Transcript_13746/m.20602 type:complete len:263 (+) Transcript_13746:80-868(+)
MEKSNDENKDGTDYISENEEAIHQRLIEDGTVVISNKSFSNEFMRFFGLIHWKADLNETITIIKLGHLEILDKSQTKRLIHAKIGKYYLFREVHQKSIAMSIAITKASTYCANSSDDLLKHYCLIINNIVVHMQQKRNGNCAVRAFSLYDTDFQVKDLKHVIVPVVKSVESVLQDLKKKYEKKRYNIRSRNCQHFAKEVVECITGGLVTINTQDTPSESFSVDWKSGAFLFKTSRLGKTTVDVIKTPEKKWKINTNCNCTMS